MKNVGIILLAVVLITVLLAGCNYNGLVKKREAVTGQWANVEAAYQRRSDLIPNLVETVKAGGKYEQETLDKIVQARASATQTKVDVNNLSQEDIDKFQAAQTNLSRLLLVMENYPDLKATQGYAELRTELTSTEDKIAFERKKFNDIVQDYNASISTFPAVITAKLFGFNAKGYFKADEGSDKAPSVGKMFNDGK